MSLLFFCFFLQSFKGKHSDWSPDSARASAGGSLPTGVCPQQSEGNTTVCVCGIHLHVREVPQQLRMDLFLSALKGNAELSESDFPR